ncbi:hypothetical protein AB0M20_40785 [Actinoplanes sp. NPDC051633]|uniref:hypothetical protein n=1 Tax=Actinoplanes sp. NPDC051633 TaxID=3155670 RepID=UPI003447C732
MLSAYFSTELDGGRPVLRSGLIDGGPEVVERLRAEFREFLTDRPMTHDEFYKTTSAWFDSDDELIQINLHMKKCFG